MRFQFLFLFVFFVGVQNLFSQDSINLAKINEYIYKQPDSAVWLCQKLILANQFEKESDLMHIKNLMGEGYAQMGDYEKAIGLHLETTKFYETKKDYDGLAYSLNQIITIYRQQNLPDEIIEVCQRVIGLEKNIKNRSIIGLTYNALGIGYVMKNQYEQASIYMIKGLQARQIIKDSLGMATSLNSVGYIYNKLEKLDSAMRYYEEGLKMSEWVKHRDMQAALLDNIGDIWAKKGQYGKAEKYYLQSLSIAQDSRVVLRIIEAYESLLALYKNKKDYYKAFQYQEKFIFTKDSLFNIEKSQQIARMEVLYEVKKKDEQIKSLNQQQESQKIQLEQAQKIRFYGIIIIALLLALGAMMFLAWKNSQKANQKLNTKNKELKHSQAKIETQKEVLAQKNEALESSNYQISQSIQAARLIQKAVQPTKKKMQHIFEEYFVIMMPKAVVSGDFWWVEQIHEIKILAVADCTGHGVAGAFMTMLGNSFLDRIVRIAEILEPDQILRELNEQIRMVLQQDITGNNNGMDMGIMVIYPEKIVFSGAKISLYYAQNGKIGSLQAVRKSVGGRQNSKTFEKKEIQKQENSIYYLFTDGYLDQNDYHRRNFTEKRLLKTLESLIALPFCEHKNKLKETIQNYSKNTEQRDDILAVGIRV